MFEHGDGAVDAVYRSASTASSASMIPFQRHRWLVHVLPRCHFLLICVSPLFSLFAQYPSWFPSHLHVAAIIQKMLLRFSSISLSCNPRGAWLSNSISNWQILTQHSIDVKSTWTAQIVRFHSTISSTFNCEFPTFFCVFFTRAWYGKI